MSKPEGDANSGEAHFKLEWDKVRAGGPNKQLSSMMVRLQSPGDDQPFDQTKTEWVFECNLNRLEKIREGLKEGRYAHQTDIATMFGVTPQQISKDIKRAEEMGLWSSQQCKAWLRKGKANATRESHMSDGSDDLENSDF